MHCQKNQKTLVANILVIFQDNEVRFLVCDFLTLWYILKNFQRKTQKHCVCTKGLSFAISHIHIQAINLTVTLMETYILPRNPPNVKCVIMSIRNHTDETCLIFSITLPWLNCDKFFVHMYTFTSTKICIVVSSDYLLLDQQRNVFVVFWA